MKYSSLFMTLFSLVTINGCISEDDTELKKQSARQEAVVAPLFWSDSSQSITLTRLNSFEIGDYESSFHIEKDELSSNEVANLASITSDKQSDTCGDKQFSYQITVTDTEGNESSYLSNSATCQQELAYISQEKIHAFLRSHLPLDTELTAQGLNGHTVSMNFPYFDIDGDGHYFGKPENFSKLSNIPQNLRCNINKKMDLNTESDSIINDNNLVLSCREKTADDYDVEKNCQINKLDPNGYLLAICEHLVSENINVSPGHPNSYQINSLWDRGDTVIVYLDCCAMGDSAVINKITNEVLSFQVGPY